MFDNDIPWPRKGDQLFKVDDDWWHNACLNYLHDGWILYADAYKCAGDLLVERNKGNQKDKDLLIYPVVFLYRQYIELRLKQIIRDGNQLLDIPEKFPKHHRIDELWKQCRKILEEEGPRSPSSDLEAVEECILQFSEKDPTSMAFRYPTDKNGNPSLPGLRIVNLRNLADVITRIGSLLDSASDGISECLYKKQEAQAEYRNSVR